MICLDALNAIRIIFLIKIKFARNYIQIVLNLRAKYVYSVDKVIFCLRIFAFKINIIRIIVLIMI